MYEFRDGRLEPSALLAEKNRAKRANGATDKRKPNFQAFVLFGRFRAKTLQICLDEFAVLGHSSGPLEVKATPYTPGLWRCDAITCG
jgi:hypothetical protein